MFLNTLNVCKKCLCLPKYRINDCKTKSHFLGYMHETDMATADSAIFWELCCIFFELAVTYDGVIVLSHFLGEFFSTWATLFQREWARGRPKAYKIELGLNMVAVILFNPSAFRGMM